MSAVETFSIIQDICVSIAAIVTAVAAWRGLESWRAELGGRAEFEAARSLIKATYNLRDVLDVFRDPWIRSQELPKGYGNTAYGNARTTTTGGQSYIVKKPSASNTIVCFSGKPENGFAYDAQFLYDSLTAKYGIKPGQ